MTTLLCMSLYVLSIVTSVHGQSIQSLKIVPDRTYLLALEGYELKLECIVEITGYPNVISPIFSKDGKVISMWNEKGFEITVTVKTLNISMDTSRSWTTLKKSVIDSSDKGVYKCDAEGEADKKTSSITVYTFTATVADADLPVDESKDTEAVELLCDVNVKASKDLVEYEVSWERDGKMIDTGDKYTINNGSLNILKPTRAELGEYQCAVTFFPTTTLEKDTVRLKPSYLKAGPAIESHDNDKTMVKGDNMTLKCNVSGFPKPTVSWFKDGASINTTTRIHTLEYEGAMGKLMIYSLEDEDEGNYKCVAENDVAPFNATAEMRVKVKDKSDSTSSVGPVPGDTPFIPLILITYFLIFFVKY